MSPSETYMVTKINNPEGMLISDVFYIEGTRKKPIVFRKVGETIDLSRVDVRSFVSSARVGILRSLEKSGTVVKMQQETAVRRTEELNKEWAAQMAQTAHVRGNSTQAQIVMLEPGLQVAVGGGSISHSGATLLEAGVYGPPDAEVAQEIFAGVSSKSAEAEVEVPVVVEIDDGIGALKATTGVSLDDIDNGHKPTAVPMAPAVVSWKDNKTIAEQEEFISLSKDKKFLQGILDDPKESKKMKNLAKKTLAALE